MTKRINVAGDLVINQQYDVKLIDREIASIFSLTDFNIVNLECPVTQAGNEDKILKTGPYLRGDFKSSLEVCQALNVSCVSLANNHLKDYGIKGIEDTFNFCNRLNI